jgi:catechol 2,3-dioxygenase-like lactoylglutathione lyase family enzyme
MSSTTEPATSIRVKAIDHVTLVVRDLEMSRRFYVDTLGMRQVSRPAFNFQGLWFQAGDTQIHLILEHPGSDTAGFRQPAENVGAGRTGHFAFQVEDAQVAVDELKRLGVRVRGGPSRRPDGFLQIWCYDPDGHVVELFSQG